MRSDFSLNTLGNPFYYHVPVEFLSLQPMFPPKPFDCSGGLELRSDFSKTKKRNRQNRNFKGSSTFVGREIHLIIKTTKFGLGAN